jgi:hypothetical protein
MKRRLLASMCAVLFLGALALINAGPRWVAFDHDDPPPPVPPTGGGVWVV